MEFLLTEQKNIWGTTVIDMSKDEHNRKHAYAKALFLTLYQQKQFISHIKLFRKKSVTDALLTPLSNLALNVCFWLPDVPVGERRKTMVPGLVH
jgi:hypothetical protein